MCNQMDGSTRLEMDHVSVFMSTFNNIDDFNAHRCIISEGLLS